MCGIAGSLSKIQLNNGMSIINRIVSSQSNRGPDNSTIEKIIQDRSFVTFGHNRLSINDLSSESNQPFWDINKRYCITFNGEIYNYIELRCELENLNFKFRTRGDVEVLLVSLIHWGEKALDKLNGMFAFCFYDKVKNTAILARDRFGKKPLYYWKNNLELYFASTPTQLAKEFKLQPNYDYLNSGLKYWIYENKSSIAQYNDLLSLPGGNYIKVDLNKKYLSLKKIKYYDLKNKVDKYRNFIATMNRNQLMGLVTDLYKDSVKIRLRSDVPLAISLSGGLDSTTIAYFANSLNSNIDGINFGDPQNKLTEGPTVSKFSKGIGMKVHYVKPHYDDIINAFEGTIKAQDSPIISMSYIAEYLVYKKANDLGFKVMLGGQGGDDRKYQLYNLKNNLRDKKYAELLLNSAYFLSLIWHESFQLKNYFTSMNRYLKRDGLSTSICLPTSNDLFQFKNSSKQDMLDLQINDILNSSVPIQVKSEDRNSMANSIETRAPLLDYRLVELGLALHPKYKLKKGFGKWIIRDIMDRKLPNQIRMAKYKRGYDVSENWFKMGLGDYIRERLYGDFEKIKPFLKKKVNIDTFNNKYLMSSSAVQEVTTLLWLSNKV